jgi:hypothetical protein
MLLKSHIRLLLFGFVLMSSSAVHVVYGQISEKEIKLSGNYYWGQGYGEQREGAINNAKRDLIEKLIVRVESESRFTERDTNEEYSVELQSTTQTSSRIELRGLNYFPAKERRDGTWETIAYLSKSAFNQSINDAEQRFLSALSYALEDERTDNMNAAIPVYMDLLASTYFYPVSFYTAPDVNGEQFELRSFLVRKLNNWINTIEWEVTAIRNLSSDSHTEFYFDLFFTYKNEPVSNLLLSLNKPGYPVHNIQRGLTSVFYDYKPDELVERFQANLNPEIYPVIEEEKQELLSEILPQRAIVLEVDFSDIINIDIELDNSNEDTWIAYPEVKNLSVFDVQWTFKDEFYSTNTLTINPSILNTDTPVQLTLNASEALSIQRIITPSGKLVMPSEAISTNSSSNENELLILQSQDVIFEIPSDKNQYLEQILKFKNGTRLTQYLNRLKSRGVIKQVGNKASMPNSELSYIAIIEPRNRKVEVVLSPVVEGYRTDLNNEKTVANATLSETYAGMGSIWFQFN